MSIEEICERLKGVENENNDFVWCIDFEKMKLNRFSCVGFAKTNRFNSRGEEEFIVYIKKPSEKSCLYMELDRVFKDRQSAINALNDYIDKQIKELEAKKH